MHSLENMPLDLLNQTWISGKFSDQFLQAPTCAQSSERIIRPWRNSSRSWKTLAPCSVKIQLSALWDDLINYSRSFRENLFKSFLSMRYLMTDFPKLKSENVPKCPAIYWFHMISPQKILFIKLLPMLEAVPITQIRVRKDTYIRKQTCIQLILSKYHIHNLNATEQN